MFYFIGTDNETVPGTSKVYTVDLTTGITQSAAPLGTYSASEVSGLWYDEMTSTLWGLFIDGGDRALAAIDPITGIVAPPINPAIAEGPVTTAPGVFTGDSSGQRVFFIGTSDNLGEPHVFEVSTADGTVTPYVIEDFDESLIMGMEWDDTRSTLWMIIHQGTGRRLAFFDFDEPVLIPAPEDILFGDSIGTNQGITALDDATGQFFFIGNPPDDSWSMFTVDVTEDGAGMGSATYQEISGSIQFGGWAGIEIIPGPELSFTKTDGDASVVPGDTVTYTLSASNAAGAGPGKGVQIVETVPSDSAFSAGDSTAGWACVPGPSAGSACTLSLSDLAPGSNDDSTFAVIVDSPVSAGVSQLSNTATLSASNTTSTFEASDQTPITSAAVLSLTKDDGGVSSIPGGVIAYTLTAANTGNQDAATVVLTDTVPANTTFDPGSSTSGWSCAPNSSAGSACSLALGTIDGGTQNIAVFAVQVIASVPAGITQISNSATLSASNATSAMASDTTPVTAEPILALVKSEGGGGTTPGSIVNYQLSYSNTGDQDTANATISETVPAQTTFNPAGSTAGWSCLPDNSAGSACSMSLGTIGGGASAAVVFSVVVDDPVLAGTTEISNQAIFDADNAAATPPATDTTPVTAAPDLTLSKSDGDIETSPGLSLSYVLVYGNDGNENAADVEITEIVPDHSTFFAMSSTPGWVCLPDISAGSTCVFDIGDLVGGVNEITIFAVTVDDSVPAGLTEIVNAASMDGSNAPSPAVAGDTTPVVAEPDLTLTKDDGGVSAEPGDVVVYTLTFGNIGDRGVADLQLTETVPAGSTFEPPSSTIGWVCIPDGSAGSTCTLDIGVLAGAGTTGIADFAVRVDEPYLLGSAEISNSAGANASDAPAPATAMDTTPINAQFDIAVTKEDQGIPARPGGTIVFTIGWENLGNQTSSGVEISETVPAGTALDAGSSAPEWVCLPDGSEGSICTYAVGVLAPGGSGSNSFAVTVDDPVAGGMTAIDNTVSIDDDGTLGADTDPSNNSASTNTLIDQSPPEVISVDSTPSVGGINNCSQLDRQVETIKVELQDVFSGVADPDWLASYMVIAAGPDQDLSTTQCGPVFGDDIEIPIDQITVTGIPTNPTATLELSSPLGNGIKLLLVCDTIVDVAGNALDGDGDGSAGGDFALRFRVDVGNEFVNAHLDDCSDAPITLSPWQDSSSPPNSVAATLANDVDESTLSGAIDIQSIDGTPIRIGQCLPTVANQRRWVEAWARIDASVATDIEISLECVFSDQPSCSSFQLPVTVASLVLNPSATPEWMILAGGTTGPAADGWALCRVVTSAPFSEPFGLSVDAMHLGDALFKDGFESGDTSAWGITIP